MLKGKGLVAHSSNILTATYTACELSGRDTEEVGETGHILVLSNRSTQYGQTCWLIMSDTVPSEPMYVTKAT